VAYRSQARLVVACHRGADALPDGAERDRAEVTRWAAARAGGVACVARGGGALAGMVVLTARAMERERAAAMLLDSRANFR